MKSAKIFVHYLDTRGIVEGNGPYLYGEKVKAYLRRGARVLDRPKISMEGKWLEQLGFHIGDKLQVVYGDRFIFISHAVGGEQTLAVKEPGSTYMAGVEGGRDKGQSYAGQKLEDAKSKQIKVTSSLRTRQTARYGGPLYYPERSKISMEGKVSLQKTGFCKADQNLKMCSLLKMTGWPAFYTRLTE